MTARADVVLVRRRRPGERTEVPDLAAALAPLGVRCREAGDEPEALDRGRFVWILGNANWFPRLRRALLERPRSRRPFTLIWHWEPLPPPAASGLSAPRRGLREALKIALGDPRVNDPRANLETLVGLAAAGAPTVLAVSTAARQETLAERGIAAEFVPLGWEPRHGRPLGRERDIDALFLGDLREPRRRRLLDALRRQGVAVEAAGGWSDPACWGEARTALLNRAKILLNLVRFEGEFAFNRFLLGMANGALVVSEPVYRPDPLEPGEDFVECAVESMPLAIRRWLADEAERARFAERARARMASEWTLARSAGRLWSYCENSNSAISARNA